MLTSKLSSSVGKEVMQSKGQKVCVDADGSWTAAHAVSYMLQHGCVEMPVADGGEMPAH